MLKKFKTICYIDIYKTFKQNFSFKALSYLFENSYKTLLGEKYFMKKWNS